MVSVGNQVVDDVLEESRSLAIGASVKNSFEISVHANGPAKDKSFASRCSTQWRKPCCATTVLVYGLAVSAGAAIVYFAQTPQKLVESAFSVVIPERMLSSKEYYRGRKASSDPDEKPAYMNKFTQRTSGSSNAKSAVAATTSSVSRVGIKNIDISTGCKSGKCIVCRLPGSSNMYYFPPNAQSCQRDGCISWWTDMGAVEFVNACQEAPTGYNAVGVENICGGPGWNSGSWPNHVAGKHNKVSCALACTANDRCTGFYMYSYDCFLSGHDIILGEFASGHACFKRVLRPSSTTTTITTTTITTTSIPTTVTTTTIATTVTTTTIATTVTTTTLAATTATTTTTATTAATTTIIITTTTTTIATTATTATTTIIATTAFTAAVSVATTTTTLATTALPQEPQEPIEVKLKLIGNGWCKDSAGKRLVFSPGDDWVRLPEEEVRLRSDGGAELCEKFCVDDPHCLGYITEDKHSCQVFNAEANLEAGMTGQMLSVDGETRNFCFIKTPGLPAWKVAQRANGTPINKVKPPPPAATCRHVGHGRCMNVRKEGSWIRTTVRGDGGADFCERRCMKDRLCMGYMTQNNNECTIISAFDVPDGWMRIEAVNSQARYQCWACDSDGVAQSKDEAIDGAVKAAQQILGAATVAGEEPVLNLESAMLVASVKAEFSFSAAVLELVAQCKEVHDAKHEGPRGDPFVIGHNALNEGNTAVKMILHTVALQLPIGEKREMSTLKSWREIEKTSMVDRTDDHNECMGICAAAGYAILPYPVSCPFGGSMYDAHGCPAEGQAHKRRLASRNVLPSNTRVAVTTIISGDKVKRGMCGLFRSGCMNNVDMHVLHADKWTGLGQKVEMVIAFLDYLVQQSDATGENWIVMLVDGYDSLVQVDTDEIKRRFFATGDSVLISSESNCFPWINPMCSMNAGVCSLYEQGERRYPNAGGIIGEARALRDILDEVRRVPSDMLRHWPGTDQGLMGQLLLTRRFPGYVVDVNSTMWATSGPQFVRARDERGISWAAGVDRSGFNKAGGDLPPAAVLHMNGAGTTCFYVMEKAAWYNKPDRRPRDKDHGDCPHDNSLSTHVYRYEADTHRLHSPRKVSGYYQQTCRDYFCSCQKCECSDDGTALDDCTFHS